MFYVRFITYEAHCASLFRGGHSTAQHVPRAQACAVFRRPRGRSSTRKACINAVLCIESSAQTTAMLRGCDLHAASACMGLHVQHSCCTEPHYRSGGRRAVGLVPHLIPGKSKVNLISYSYYKLINLHFWWQSLIKQHKLFNKVIRLQIR